MGEDTTPICDLSESLPGLWILHLIFNYLADAFDPFPRVMVPLLMSLRPLNGIPRLGAEKATDNQGSGSITEHIQNTVNLL